MRSRSDRPNWRVPPPVQKKSSYGIACCRIVNNKLEIIAVCKRFSYAFNCFVNGKYSANDLQKLFDSMTVDEKLDILSLDFKQLWYKFWSGAYHRDDFIACKSKFENNFLKDGGIKLKSMIKKSTSVGKLWEVPKGRRKSSEIDTQTAMREFYEETGIHKRSYQMSSNFITINYIDEGVIYYNKYYIAIATQPIEPKIDFGNAEQIIEVCDVRWMNLSDINFVKCPILMQTYLEIEKAIAYLLLDM